MGSFSLKQKFSLLRNQGGIMYEINVLQQPVLSGALSRYSKYALLQMYQIPMGMILQGAEEKAGKAHARKCVSSSPFQCVR